MAKFDSFFLMTTEAVKEYVVDVLHFWEPGTELYCEEIGDGNINYVFRIWARADGRSVVVKQADRLLRSSGRPLDMNRNKIEAHMLRQQRQLAPAYVPEVYHYDEIMAAVSMEDISAYRNLRKELMAGVVHPHLAENLAVFLSDTLLPTTDLVMDRQAKKAQVKFYTNPELCDITEDLVLTEPYYNYKKRNIITPGNEDFVREFLYEDEELHANVAMLRDRFMNQAQALLHGDLHTGSIFVNEQGVKVIDPEFAFYGPMGYDIGNVIGNLFFAWANKHFTDMTAGETECELEETIATLYDLTREKLEEKYEELVTLPLYRCEEFEAYYLDEVMADALGYAGTEIIRRVVGDSKVMEVSGVADLAQRILMERALIKLGIGLIKRRYEVAGGDELTSMFRLIFA